MPMRTPHAKEQVYFWRTLDGETGGEIATAYDVGPRTVQHRLQDLRSRLTTWTEQVSYAAAD